MTTNRLVDELSKANLSPENIEKRIGLGKRVEVKNQARTLASKSAPKGPLERRKRRADGLFHKWHSKPDLK
ncbi:hypothetical protein [Larkinella terrae]|uniref:Uncharacterized protein n=1 Tax=Larkinella terrae TaxID=2025311 RepID=A0A7K0EVU4_9BACT|nr:hypothetical protein [Larkinella terrae]MRS65940.1 hypothetical protein [Larkinella terrae]